jgi:hypothetical protein
VKLYNDSEGSKSKDYSGIGIIITNVLVIIYAVIDDWDLGSMMLIYWVQSVTIGFFHFFRILLLRSFCTEGFTSNGQRVPETAKGKWSTALFFAVHYGFFHLIYLFFLFGIDSQGAGDEIADDVALTEEGGIPWGLLSVIGFFLGHGYSFYQNVKADLKRRPSLGTMMFLPYARIIPMHLTIIFGNMIASSTVTVLLFSTLKTGADYLMHIVEHRILQKPPTNDS